MSRPICALADSLSQADQLIASLSRAGIARGDITVSEVADGDGGTWRVRPARLSEGCIIGMMLGALLGAELVWLAAWVKPSLVDAAPVLARHPFLTFAAGMTVMLVVGGIVGQLIGARLAARTARALPPAEHHPVRIQVRAPDYHVEHIVRGVLRQEHVPILPDG